MGTPQSEEYKKAIENLRKASQHALETEALNKLEAAIKKKQDEKYNNSKSGPTNDIHRD